MTRLYLTGSLSPGWSLPRSGSGAGSEPRGHGPGLALGVGREKEAHLRGGRQHPGSPHHPCGSQRAGGWDLPFCCVTPRESLSPSERPMGVGMLTRGDVFGCADRCFISQMTVLFCGGGTCIPEVREHQLQNSCQEPASPLGLGPRFHPSPPERSWRRGRGARSVPAPSPRGLRATALTDGRRLTAHPARGIKPELGAVPQG